LPGKYKIKINYSRFIEYYEEAYKVCLCELKVETNLDGRHFQLLRVKGYLLRDP